MMVIRRRRKAGSLKLVRKSKSFNQETLTRSFKGKKDNCFKFSFFLELFCVIFAIVTATGVSMERFWIYYLDKGFDFG